VSALIQRLKVHVTSRLNAPCLPIDIVSSTKVLNMH